MHEEEEVHSLVERPVLADSDQFYNTVRSHDVTVLQFNIRSLKKNWDQFYATISPILDKNVIIVLQEVNVHENVINTYNIEGYRKYYMLRQTRRGGGIVIFVPNGFRCVVLTEKMNLLLELMHMKFTCIDVLGKQYEFHVIAVYRPPKYAGTVNFIRDLDEALSDLSLNTNVIFLGDVNINTLQESNLVKDYLTTLAAHSLESCIHEETRVEVRKDGRCTRSCIDHVAVRMKLAKVSAAIFQRKISDHFIAVCSFTYDLPKPLIRNHVQKTNRIDVIELDKNLKEFNWGSLLTLGCPCEVYEKLVQVFETAYEASKRSGNKGVLRKRNLDHKEWITAEIIKDLNYRDKLYKRHRDSPRSEIIRKEYTRFRNKLIKKIQMRKKEYYCSRILECQKDSGKVWKEINKLLGRKDEVSVDEFVFKNFPPNKTEKELCDEFVHCFEEGVQNARHDCGHRFLPKEKVFGRYEHSGLLEEFCPTTASEISDIISNFEVKKSPGIDNIRICDLQRLKDVFSPVIAHLINLIFKTGVVPDNMKIAVVRPVYKRKGEKDNCSNYRPISLLPVIEKIMEKVVMKQLSRFVRENDVIDKKQYGFQRGKSADMLLEDFGNFVNSSLNKKMHVLLLFADFEKAFDVINHKTLIQILETVGIRGQALVFFESYLRNRKMTVRLGSSFSVLVSLLSGVPQGSILGPLLFILYVNNISSNFQFSNHFMFADDLSVAMAHEQLCAARIMLQKDFNVLQKWIHDVGISLSRQKTKLMHVRAKNKKTEKLRIVFHDHACLQSGSEGSCDCNAVVEQVDFYKYLGVIIDTLFSWNKQGEYLNGRLRSALFGIATVKKYLPANLLRVVYFALFDSLLRYGLTAWGLVTSRVLENIRKVQDRAVRVVTGKDVTDPMQREEGYKLLGAYPVDFLLNYKLVVLNYESSFYFDEFVPRIRPTSCANSLLFKVPRTNNNYGDRTIRVQIPSLLNNLPVVFREYPKMSTAMVKKELERILEESEWLDEHGRQCFVFG